MKFKTVLLGASLATAGLGIQSNVAMATTTTANMTVQITIQNACSITTAPTTLNFGTQGPLLSNVDQTSGFSVTCTSGASYNIGLDGGGSGDINARVMTLSTDQVGYQLYSNAGRTTVWGNTVGTDTVSATGTGSAQAYTVYGRVPPQTTPPAGTYTDTVVVTVTY